VNDQRAATGGQGKRVMTVPRSAAVVAELRPEPTNKERIYDYVKNRINNGIYQPGQSLRIADLAAELSVSQTPVREALILLEGEDLVDFRPYKGAVVKGLSRGELKEIFAIRTILENAALEYAIPRMTPELIAEARELLRQSGAAENKERFSELNWQFHALIQRQTGMPLLCQMIESLSDRVKRYSRVYYLAEPERFMSDHMLQLDLYEKGDVEGAKALHKRQIEHVVALVSPLLPE